LYLTREDIVKVIERMKGFEQDLNSVFAAHSYNFREDIGRRNALLSVSQEREVARVLSEKFNGVVQDGSPGKPDIYINDIDTELECKLTSGSKSKNTISYQLQTDWESLCAKGKLDYLYIITNKTFDKFCVLFFEGLTSDDFFPPSNGSRGKSRMNKGKAMEKVTCLMGNYMNHNDVHINKIVSESMKELKGHTKRMTLLHEKHTTLLKTDTIKRNKVVAMKDRETIRHRVKAKSYTDRKAYWENTSKRYRFIFETA
jgi:hypothetical protein